MTYKTMKVFDIRELPEDLKQETIEWLGDLNRNATTYDIGSYGEFTPMDDYLMSEGCVDEEEVMLFWD